MKTQVASPRVRKSWLTDPLWIAEGNWGCSRKVPALGEQPGLPQPVLPDPIRFWLESLCCWPRGMLLTSPKWQNRGGLLGVPWDICLVAKGGGRWGGEQWVNQRSEGHSFCPSESSQALLLLPPSDHLPLMTANNPLSMWTLKTHPDQV